MNLKKLHVCIPAIALAGLFAACAPRLVIVHQDPSASFVQIRVDDENRGFVEPGSKWRSRVTPGYHRVEAIPRGESANPWAEDGVGWTVFIERKTELTLLPQP